MSDKTPDDDDHKKAIDDFIKNKEREKLIKKITSESDLSATEVANYYDECSNAGAPDIERCIKEKIANKNQNLAPPKDDDGNDGVKNNSSNRRKLN